MENYLKAETVEEKVEEVSQVAFNVPANTVIMKVKPGSKINNLIGYALRTMKPDDTKQIVFVGSGAGITKTVSCVEIMKRKMKNLHQISKVNYIKVEEYWEPKTEGLERLKVTKNIPAIQIMLSKDPVDSSDPSYQSPGSFDEFWKDSIMKERQQRASKRKKKLPLHAVASGMHLEGVEASTNKKKTGKLSKKYKVPVKKEKESA